MVKKLALGLTKKGVKEAYDYFSNILKDKTDTEKVKSFLDHVRKVRSKHNLQGHHTKQPGYLSPLYDDPKTIALAKIAKQDVKDYGSDMLKDLNKRGYAIKDVHQLNSQLKSLDGGIKKRGYFDFVKGAGKQKGRGSVLNVKSKEMYKDGSSLYKAMSEPNFKKELNEKLNNFNLKSTISARDAASVLGISYQKFHNLLRGLQRTDPGIVSVGRNRVLNVNLNKLITKAKKQTKETKTAKSVGATPDNIKTVFRDKWDEAFKKDFPDDFEEAKAFKEGKLLDVQSNIDHITGFSRGLQDLGMGSRAFQKFVKDKTGKHVNNLTRGEASKLTDDFIELQRTSNPQYINLPNVLGKNNLQQMAFEMNTPGMIKGSKGTFYDARFHNIFRDDEFLKQASDEANNIRSFFIKGTDFEIDHAMLNMENLKDLQKLTAASVAPNYKGFNAVMFNTADDLKDKALQKKFIEQARKRVLKLDKLTKKRIQKVMDNYDVMSKVREVEGFETPALPIGIQTVLKDAGVKNVFSDGGSVGIQPVANPTQKFDIEVKQMMETTGLDFSDSIIELMKDNAKREKFNIGGMVGGNKKGFALDDESLGNKVGALESLLAGIGAGLIDIPKGAFTLGAALMDVGFGTNNSAKMEAWFDDLTDWDEKAEQHWLGSFARIATNLGVPGAYGFKAGERLARNALLAKRNGNYFRLTDPVLQEKFKTSLNAKGRLLATLGGAAGVGATDAIFVGDPEGVGTFGDMIGAGPTELDPNDANLASKEIANRVRFGVDGALFLGLIGGTGSAVKSLARRRNELESNNDAIDKFFSVFRPRGKKSQAFFDMERQNIGARAGDINFAGEQARKLDKHIDAIFPFVKNPFNKLGNKGRSEFMDKLNDTLLSGEIRMDPSGKVNFGPMDEKLINQVKKIMRSKNAKKEDIDGVFDSFEQMRLGWGHIFSRLGYSMDDAARTEFKELFGNKFKSYLGSTYEIFQNKSLLPFLRYKPTEEAVEKTIKLFMDSASEAGKPISRGEAELFVNRAIETVKMPRDISTSKEKTTGIYFDAPEFFANKTVLDEIELGKKTVAFDDLAADSKKIMAELFGKVSDPMQTMLTGTNRLSLIGRRNQFFNDLVQADDVLIPKREEFLKANPGASLPKELKGFFRETEAEAVEAFGGNIKKIEIDPSRTIEAGITNPVNGKYAERGVAEALEEASQVAADKSTLQQMYESFILYPKATSQLAKTVLSPITHVRNFVSAGAFATANGLIPGLVSPEDFGRAFKEAFGQLQIPGARMDNERYRELLRLGVVNSNVRLGDLQRLLKDTNFGESVNSRKALRELMRPFSKFKKFTEDAYTAEDDFWKLTSFALERQRLGRAYEKYGIAKTAKELDEEAADIIRNNIPNYDMVNDFIKATRKLPLGNFVSFPAEIMRTTANILNRSLKEINFEHTLSDGRIVKPLQGIGYKRLFGMGTTVVGVPYATSEAFKAIYDVTEDEMQALRRFVPDWSKNSTILPIRGDDGKLKYIDFSHANAYDTMIRPINSMIIGVQRGVEEGELAKEVLKSMYEGTKETLSPFFSESIWTNALSDIVIRNGRTREGRRLYTDQTPWGERVNKSLLHLAETQFPGSIASFQRLDLAFEPVDILKKGKFDEYGNTFNIPDEALGFVGLRAVEVDPVKAMKFKIADFRTGINNARREFTSPLLRGGPTTPQQIADRYQIASESLYNVQEKMFRDYFAAMQLGAKVGQLDNEFADRVSNVQLRSIKRGEFKPFIPSENIEAAFAENARNIGQPNPYIQAKPFIRNLIRLYDGVPFGVGLPNIRNPFQQDRSLPIQGSPAFQGLSNPLQTNSFGALTPRNTQQTAIKGQQVFGATDPIFGS